MLLPFKGAVGAPSTSILLALLVLRVDDLRALPVVLVSSSCTCSFCRLVLPSEVVRPRVPEDGCCSSLCRLEGVTTFLPASSISWSLPAWLSPLDSLALAAFDARVDRRTG